MAECDIDEVIFPACWASRRMFTAHLSPTVSTLQPAREDSCGGKPMSDWHPRGKVQIATTVSAKSIFGSSELLVSCDVWERIQGTALDSLRYIAVRGGFDACGRAGFQHWVVIPKR